MVRFRSSDLWRDRAFRNLWVAQTISAIGSQVTLLALPLAAVLTLHATPVQLGLLQAVQYLPYVVLGLLAGVLVDRTRRRPILVWSDLGRAALLGSIPVVALAHRLSLAQLFVVGPLVAVLSTLFNVAYGAFLPSLVHKERVVGANSALEASRSAAGIVGPGLAGWLVAAFTAPVAIAADALSFLASAFVLGRIHVVEPLPRGGREVRDIGREVVEGLRLTLGNPVLRAILVSTGLFNLFGSAIGAVYVLYVTRDIGIRPGILGLIAATAPPGALLGAALGGRIGRRFGPGRTILGALLLAGVADLLIPLAGALPVVSVALLVGQQVLFGIGATIYTITMTSLAQISTPDRLLGRWRAGALVVGMSAAPVGALVGGIAGGVYGLQPMLTVASVGLLLTLILLSFSPLRSLHEWPTSIGEVPTPPP